MDKNTTTGILLILMLTFFWILFNQPPLPDQTNQFPADSSGQAVSQPTDAPTPQNNDAGATIAERTQDQTSLSTETRTTINEGIQSDSLVKVIHFENEVVKATFSNARGGSIVDWHLKQYDYHFDDSTRVGNVNLATGNEFLLTAEDISRMERRGLDVEIVDPNGKMIHLSDYTLHTDLGSETRISLNEDNPQRTIEFYLPLDDGRLVTQYTFYHDRYGFDISVKFENLEKFIGYKWYSMNWENGMESTEENAYEDFTYSNANAYLDGELESLDVTDVEELEESPSGNKVDWVAVRTKYFVAAIVPEAAEKSQNATLSGYAHNVKLSNDDDLLVKNYSVSLNRNLPGSLGNAYEDKFTVYLGPLDVETLGVYNVGLDDLVMNNGWYESIFRIFTIYMVLPAFKFLHSFIPNYGIAIILFAIIIKIILYPLTKKSYESTARMQELQPLMKEIQEKHKDNPQRYQKEIMKLYKEQGFNPLGGCLPMLLQMPLLIALFIVFRSTIQLRGEPFVAWITDLSKPDVLAKLDFSIPFLGDSLCVLPLLMGATMILQSKATMTDPKQKALVYFMPVILIFVFYTFPSGLNLYYAVFNVLTALQTRMIKKNMPAAPQPAKAAAAASKNGKKATAARKPASSAQKSKSRSRKKKR